MLRYPTSQGINQVCVTNIASEHLLCVAFDAGKKLTEFKPKENAGHHDDGHE